MKPVLAAVEQPQDAHVTVSASARQIESSLEGRMSRVSGMFKSASVSRTNINRAKDELLAIAEEALALRRNLD